MKPRLLKRSFTMIELVVSMGIFSILTLALMQFFTSAQNAWTGSERRAQLYADSRVVFDLIANAVKAAPRDQIVTSSTQILCPVTAADGTTGEFVLTYDADDYRLDLKMPSASGSHEGELLDGVMAFSATRYQKDFSNQGTGTGNADTKFIVVTLQLLSYPDFREYQSVPDANKADYLTNHAYNFVRMIILP